MYSSKSDEKYKVLGYFVRSITINKKINQEKYGKRHNKLWVHVESFIKKEKLKKRLLAKLIRYEIVATE